MASNDGAAGPPDGPPSPRKLWVEAKGDPDRYIELMIKHGHISKTTAASIATAEPPPFLQENAAQAISEANAPLCATCRRLVSLTDKGMVKVHFASPTDTRPCPGSYQAWNG